MNLEYEVVYGGLQEELDKEKYYKEHAEEKRLEQEHNSTIEGLRIMKLKDVRVI